MKLYVDESGSISSSKASVNRYFIVAYVQTKNPNNVIRQFRKAKTIYFKQHPDIKFDLQSEIKGSEMAYGMKKMIFDRLSNKSDIKFHFKIIDNHNLTDRLIDNPSISFNYFVNLSLKSICASQEVNGEPLFMLIDERNQSVESLNSLEEYLKIQYSLEQAIFTDIKIRYKDSKTKDLIQIADIFANTLYRICVNHSKGGYDKRDRKLLSSCHIGCNNYFPRDKNDLDICKKTVD